MNKNYEYLFDLIFKSEPMTDRDVDSLYRYAAGNGHHPLHGLAVSITFDQFLEMYRQVEKDVKAACVE